MKQFRHPNPTLLSLTGALLLTALFVAHILVPRHRSTLPDNIHLPLLSNGVLETPGVEGCTLLFAGDTVTLLGVLPSDGHRHPTRFWVETSDGMLGYADPSLFDSVGIVRRTLRHGEFQKGDRVALLGRYVNASGWHQYEVRRRDGTLANLNANDVATPTARRLMRSHAISPEQPRRLMSTQTFERRYLRHSYRKNRTYDMPPLLAVANDTGFTTLENICLLGKDGRWYRPRLCYNRDSIATSYKVSEGFECNRTLSALLYPALQTMLRSPLTAWQGSRPMYRLVTPQSHQGLGRVLAYLRLGVLWVLCYLPWLYLTPLLPSWLLFFLMRYPPLRRLDSRTLRWLLAGVAVVSALLWFVALLPVIPAVLYLVEVPVVALYLLHLRHGLLGEQLPHARCPRCHGLHTVRPAGKFLEKESEEWNSRYAASKGTTEALPATVADPYADEDVLYRIREYRHRFRCRQCGHTEETVSHELEEIDRKKKASRTESYRIRRSDADNGPTA